MIDCVRLSLKYFNFWCDYRWYFFKFQIINVHCWNIGKNLLLYMNLVSCDLAGLPYLFQVDLFLQIIWGFLHKIYQLWVETVLFLHFICLFFSFQFTDFLPPQLNHVWYLFCSPFQPPYFSFSEYWFYPTSLSHFSILLSSSHFTFSNALTFQFPLAMLPATTKGLCCTFLLSRHDDHTAIIHSSLWPQNSPLKCKQSSSS